MNDEKTHEERFSQLDTVAFLAVTLVIVHVGTFKSFCKRPSTPKEFLVGDRDSSIVEVCSSTAIQAAPHALLAVTWAFLPGLEIVHLASAFGALIAGAVTVFLFTPVLYGVHENSISIYTFLEQRFNSPSLRRFIGALYAAESCVLLAVHIYTPSLTISQVYGIPTELCIWLIACGACATSVLSGVRGLLWANVLQVLLFFGGLLAVLIEANEHSTAFVENAKNHINSTVSQLNGWSFSAHLLAWTAHWIIQYVSHQNFAQRTGSAKNLTAAQISTGVSSIMIFFFMLIGSFVGSCLKAAHAKQHFFEAHNVDRTTDQVIYYFVHRVFRNTPGLSGFITGMLFSVYVGCAASLCNAVTAVVFQDFAMPCFGPDKKIRFRLNVARCLGLVVLGISVSLASLSYFVEIAPSILLNLTGNVGGPIVALFTVGILSSRCSLKAAMCGVVSGLSIALFASCIFYMEGPHRMSPVVYLAGYRENFQPNMSTGKIQEVSTDIREWFSMLSASLVWVELLTFLVSTVITVFSAMFTTLNKPKETEFNCHVASEFDEYHSRSSCQQVCRLPQLMIRQRAIESVS